MKRLLFIPFILASSLFADDQEDAADKHKKILPPSISEGNIKSVMMIDPKERASDFIKAFETLRKEIAPNKIFFHIAKGSAINNVMDLSLMENGTLLIFRVSTPQGPQYKIVPVEDVLDVSHVY